MAVKCSCYIDYSKCPSNCSSEALVFMDILHNTDEDIEKELTDWRLPYIRNKTIFEVTVDCGAQCRFVWSDFYGMADIKSWRCPTV